MSSSENAMSLSMLAGAAFVEGDFGKCVKISADNTVVLVSGLLDRTVGILGSAPALINDTVPVVPLSGARGKLKAGGTITVGQILIPAADGEVTGIDTVLLIPAGVFAVGLAVEGAVDQQLFEAVLYPITGNIIV